MKSIWGRQNKPKLKLEVNEIGQPCGNSATRFANFIGTQIRTKGFPLAFDDWRKVDLPLKLGLWTQAKLFWDIDQGSFEWYMKTAQTKWREFKADLKKDWYDESMEYHELISSCDDRVHPDQWKWLVDHWLTPEAKARSIRGKANRAKHTQNHTAGSKSFARVDTEMTEELKRRPRRDEMLIRTHTHKSGVPQKGSASTIEKLQTEAKKHPELLEKSIKDGDLFSHVCGKEKSGYVRVVGLGPTPSDLEFPGTRKYKSTKLQMETEARRVADRRAEYMQQEMDELRQQMVEMKQMFLSSQGQQEENNNAHRHGSHTQQNTRTPEDFNEGANNSGNHILEDEAESNASMQVVNRNEDHPGRRIANVEKQPNRQHGGGRDVVVYSMARPFNVPVAKGTIQTTDPKAMVGGEPLGDQYVEIVIHSVFKRGTLLPRPYGDVVTMGDACGKSIAWPAAMMKDNKTRTTVLGEEREVRKITTMKSIWGRQNKPKLKLEVNEIGQPCGNSATRFANFIGTQIRTKGFPLAFDDWRKVDLPLKLGLWTQAKLFWDIDQGSFEWYMKTAQTKWREFKADLKKDWYDESMEYHELISSCDDRVHPDQWKWLVDHWLTPEAKARSIRGKANRAKHTQNHTAGSKSFARVDTEMTEELKRRPRRDEMLIRTHTHKSGVPQKGSASTIEKLQTEAKKHPELLEKSIKDGDLFSHVCGKEKSGYVRVVGLGPTPSDLEFPGTRKYKSTKLQMETEARRVADRRAEYMQQEMDELRQQMVEMKQMFLSSQGQQEENNNAHRHGSHTQQNTRTPEDFNEGANNSGNHILEDEAESNASMQVVNRNEDHPGRRIANVEKQPNRQHGGGRDVVVYSMARPFNVPVAKGTIQTTDPKAMVGGEPLGDQYVEIVIHSVFKRGTLLPRPYGDVVTMGDACGKSIAWPAAMVRTYNTYVVFLCVD
ncbi:hypothetical protein ACQ4PT_022407 [Festuca glaucescens]